MALDWTWNDISTRICIMFLKSPWLITVLDWPWNEICTRIRIWFQGHLACLRHWIYLGMKFLRGYAFGFKVTLAFCGIGLTLEWHFYEDKHWVSRSDWLFVALHWPLNEICTKIRIWFQSHPSCLRHWIDLGMLFVRGYAFGLKITLAVYGIGLTLEWYLYEDTHLVSKSPWLFMALD